MIDLKQLLEKPEETRKSLSKKHYDGDLNQVIELEQQKKALMHKTETLKAEQNQIAKQIPSANEDEKRNLLAKSAELKEQLKKMEPELKDLETHLNKILLTIPNPPHESVPEGKDETANKVIKTVGQKREFDFPIKDHVELGTNLNLLEIEKAVEMSGARFYYLKNDLVMLEFALVQFALNKLQQKGFTPIIPPMLVKEHAMEATGFFPADKNMIYHVNPQEDDLYLIGTAEVPLCMLHANEIIDEKKLPLRYCGYSSCYRREAGTYGKDMQGIFRVHQFEKIEMFSFCQPENSWQEHEKILAIEEEIMQELGLHYQVVNICGGDLGAPAAKKYDIEVWIPSMQKYRELTSCSNCTDYQARRAQIRIKKADGTKQILHTLNGTAIAMTRMIIAIMENHQQADGTIAIPDVLKPYFNKQIISKHE
jgi:seryl-tRNA synthetase